LCACCTLYRPCVRASPCLAVLAFAVGSTLFPHGAISIGTAYLLVTYAALISQPLLQLTTQMQDFQQATAAIGRVQELLAQRSAVAESADGRFPSGALAVELAGVSFGYADGPLVLQDVSFTVAPGRVLGVVGRTGSGKSTLTRLLMRLYDPTDGAVPLGGVDLRTVAQRELCRQVALVTQEVQVFQGTVRDNLTFFDPAIPDTRILAAFGELGLWSWYAALPHGLDTELAAGGAGLSAGEAQLLVFTRVFLRDPRLVILDEASSRLDPATERAIERAVDRLLRGRTAIVLAHRLADGRIVEHGRREQLANDPTSRFADLLRIGLEVAVV
jgi:ATP-binding cassette, subfamily B, bacterial